MEIYILDINTLPENILTESIRNSDYKIVFGNKLKEKQHYAGRYLLSKILREFYSMEYFETEIIKGKPYLKNNPYYFSISHSENIVGIAIGKEEVGFDIEYNKKIRNYSQILKRYNQNIPEDSDIQKELYEFWTQHEAKIKLSSKFNEKVFYHTSVFNDNYTYSVALKNSFDANIAVHLVH